MRARPSSRPCRPTSTRSTGTGVHIITVNDYLAERDVRVDGPRAPLPRPEVGVILVDDAAGRAPRAVRLRHHVRHQQRVRLRLPARQHGAGRKNELVQRGHNFAIVDEVDSILIDEARTPLIISGPADQATKWYAEFAKIVGQRLRRETDYEVDEKKRTVGILESGIAQGRGLARHRQPLRVAPTPRSSATCNNAIKAKELFKRDKDYVVMDGEVLIVDEHTGRILAGRRYNEGMHQAIEAKEGVEIKQENQTLATITLQNFFRLYEKLSGMTGTAMTEAAEFDKIYRLGVVPIPTNRPMVRDRPVRPRLPHRGGQVQRGRRRHRRAAREGPAGARRHHVASRSREHLSPAAAQARRPARGAQRQVARA